MQAVQKKRIVQQATTRCNLTVQELSGLPDSIPCFESVGRACAAFTARAPDLALHALQTVAHTVRGFRASSAMSSELIHNRFTCRRYFKKDKTLIVEEQQQQVADGGGQMEGLVRMAEASSQEIRAIEAELSEFLKSNQDVARQFLAQSR